MDLACQHKNTNQMTKHKRPSTNSGTTCTTGDSNSIIKAFSRVKSASIRSMKSYLIADHFNYQKGLFPGGTGSTTCTTGTGTGSIDNSSSSSDVSNYSDLLHSKIRPNAKPDNYICVYSSKYHNIQ